MTTSVITVDIVKSRNQTNRNVWIDTLKKALSHLNADQDYWDVYRGDSFQIEIKDYFSSFKHAVYIKACIKMIKGLDVRLAIGIGAKTYQGDRKSTRLNSSHVKI